VDGTEAKSQVAPGDEHRSLPLNVESANDSGTSSLRTSIKPSDSVRIFRGPPGISPRNSSANIWTSSSSDPPLCPISTDLRCDPLFLPLLSDILLCFVRGEDLDLASS
jgi:hypothetical protein